MIDNNIIIGRINKKYESFLTNFSLDGESRYRKVIEIYENITGNAGLLYISDKAYWYDGTRDYKLKSLHTRKDIDLSCFWRILDLLKDYKYEEEQMKLYCVELTFNEEVVDVQHLVGENNKSIHKRLDKTLEQCELYDVDINGYRFHEVKDVDVYNVILKKIK